MKKREREKKKRKQSGVTAMQKNFKMKEGGNKRVEGEGRKKILEEHQSRGEVQRSWHTYDSLFHSLRPSPPLNIFSFRSFFPSPPSFQPFLPPSLSVLLFVIWPSWSFKSASSPPPPPPPTSPPPNPFSVSFPLVHKLIFTISAAFFSSATLSSHCLKWTRLDMFFTL